MAVQDLEVDGASPSHAGEQLRDVRNPQGSFLLTNAADVTWENLDAANFYINESQDVTIRGGDWGQCTVPGPCSNSKLDVEAGERIVIENARFHDYRIVPGSGQHFECIIIFGGESVSLINNRFENCEFYNIFLQHPVWAEGRYNGRTPARITMRNNVFNPTLDNGNQGRTSAIAFSSRGIPFTDIQITANWFADTASVSVDDDGLHVPVQNFSIARNSFASGRVMVDNIGLPGLSVSGNVARTGNPCLTGVSSFQQRLRLGHVRSARQVADLRLHDFRWQTGRCAGGSGRRSCRLCDRRRSQTRFRARLGREGSDKETPPYSGWVALPGRRCTASRSCVPRERLRRLGRQPADRHVSVVAPLSASTRAYERLLVGGEQRALE